MRLAIIGLPGAGKTTLFNALTGQNLPTGEWSGTTQLDVHASTVDVPDDRLEALREKFNPPKMTHAKVTVTDVGGLQAGVGRQGLPGPLVNQLEQMDGFLLVVRSFADPTVPHPQSSVDPRRDLETMEAEILLHDMLTVERRLEALREEKQKKGGQDKADLEQMVRLLERLSDALAEEQPLRRLALDRGDEVLLSGSGLLTRKPLLVVANIGEGEEAVELGTGERRVHVLSLQAKLEMEIGQMPPEEAQAFRAEYGIDEPTRDRVVRSAYDLLALQTFFTMNEKELRAWAIPQGASALDAAHTIHSDIGRGFIRAEVIRWDELLKLGGLAEARSEGMLRLEGKKYPVSDGDVIQVRFNI